MKKIILISSFALAFIFTSCESDDKNIFLELERAHSVTMKIQNEDISLSGSSFVADVDAYKVSTHTLSVFQQSVNDTVPFATYNEFPFQLTISRQDIANALSINIEDIQVNDRFIFLGRSVAEDGTVYTIDDFFALGGPLINNPNMNFSSKAYRFTVDIIE